MKLRSNPFLRSASLAASIVFTLGQAARADLFDINSTTSGFGVVNGSTYDWWTAGIWSDGTAAANDAGTAATVTWQGTSLVSEHAFFIGSGVAGNNYTVRLGTSGSTDTYIQNLAINVNAAASGALTGAAGNVTVGNSGDTGLLILRAANSVGAQNSGTLTVNNGVNLNAQTMNFRGGNVVLNGAVSGTGASNLALASGAFGLTSGTLTLAGNNSFAGSTSVASGYILNLQHANALGAAGGTNTVASGGILQISSGASIVSGENVTINGPGGTVGSLRAGSGGGTWAGGVSLGDTAVRIGALAAQTLTITGSIANGATGTGFNISGESGTGIVILNPTTSNSYTGTTGIIRGILRLGKTDALPTGTTLDVDSVSNVTDAAAFDLASFNQTVAALQDSAGGAGSTNGKITNSVASTISTLTVNQASNTAFDGIIENGSGSVVLTKGGVGNLTLTGPNTFKGGTNIKNGSIIIGGGFNDRLATGGSVVLGDVSTTGKLVLGDATTARNQTLAGLTSTGLGGSVVGAHATTNSVLTLAIASGTNTFAGTLGGAGTNENKLALTKNGAGILNLTGPNTYSGPTILTQGTLQIGVNPVGAITSSAIGTGTLTFNGGTLSSDGGTARTIGNAVTFTGNASLGDATNNGKLTFTNTMDLGATARTITVNSEVQLDGSFTNSNATSGLIKAGAGTLTINNANTSFGNTNGFTITGGTVVAANTAAMGNAGQIITLSSGSNFGTLDLATDTSANAYVLNFGSLAGAGGTILVNRATSGSGAGIIHTLGIAQLGNTRMNVLAGGNVTIGTTPTLELNGITLTAGTPGDGAATLNPTTASVLVSGNITRTGASANSLVLDGTSSGNLISGIISGPQALTKSNVSIWELSNANTFTGTTKVTSGTLKLTNNLAIQSSAFDTSGTGTLDISTINTPTFGGLTSATDYALPGNVTSLTLNPGSGITQTYTGNLSGGTAGLTLTKTGTSTQVLGGTNSYTGLTTVSGGELNIQNAGAIGGTDVTVTSGAQLGLQGGITVSGKSITTSGSGRASGTGAFIGGLQSVSGTNEWAGSVLLGADLSRMGARKNAILVLSGAIDDGANTYTMVVRNENQFNTSGGGNATTITELSGVSTYGGNTQLIAGVTRLGGGDNRLPTGTILQFGGTGANAKFDMNGFSQEVAGLAVMNNTTDTQRDWNANELTNSTGTLSTLTVNTAADQTFGITPTNFGGRENYTGIITGKIELVKSGTAKLTLSGTNTYTDGTSIDNGTLALGHATDTLANGGAVNVNGGTLALGTNTDTVGAVTLTSGSITGSGAAKLTGSGSNFDVRSGTISAKLGGTVGLDKTTGGTVTITSDNSVGGYTGATTVTAGTLIIDGNISTSTTTVSGTGILGGSGSVGDLTIAAGGTHNPGNSPGIMNTGDYTMEGTLNLDLNGTTAGTAYDQINATGSVILSGTLAATVGYTPVNGDLLFILLNDGTDAITTTFSGLAQGGTVSFSGLDWKISYNADSTANTFTGTLNGNDIALMAIPEPNVAALLGGLGTLLLLRRRRTA